MDYKISDTTINDIKSAIGVKRGSDMPETVKGERFDDEILLIDRLKRMTNYNSIDQDSYGLLASYCAGSYEFARYDYANNNNGKNLFDYDTANSPLSSNHKVRNSSGQCYIDCSTLVGLACRGIYFQDSPYSAHTSANSTWTPSSEISGMRSSWGIKVLDYQAAGAYSNLGLGANVGGHSSIRTSADLAEFFYRNGKVLYEKKFDGELNTDAKATALIEKLAPGDLIFWSTYPDDTDMKRFRFITHVAMVAPEKNYFIEATGKVTSVVRRQHFINDTNTHKNYDGVEETCKRYMHMVLAIRPRYGPQPEYDTPLNINLLRFPWSWGVWSKSESAGVERTCTGINEIKLVGKSTSANNWSLRGDGNDSNDKLLLTPGTYRLRLECSGSTFPSSTALALQFRNSTGGDLSPTVRAYNGSDATITISSTANYVIYLHVNGGVNFDCTVKPSLVRTS